MAEKHIESSHATIRPLPDNNSSTESVETKVVNESAPTTDVIQSQDPHSWSFRKKVFHTAVPALYGFTVTAGSSVYVPGMAAIMTQFNVSRGAAVLGISLYSEGLALGPMLGAPISETLGRRGVYLITGPLFLLCTLGSALAPNIETLIIFRFLAALFGSPALAVGAGTVADIWDMYREGGIVSILFISTFFLGPSIGPVVGGYTFETRHSWRWLMWAIMLASGPLLIVSLFTQETYLKIIQRRQAKKQGISHPTSPSGKPKWKTLLVSTLFRPLVMIAREPIVTVWALYHSFIFGVLFGFFGSYYYVFVSVYQFSEAQVGLAFLAVFVGILLAILVFVLIDRLIYQKRRSLYEGGRAPPEERLWAAMFGAFCLPLSLFWFGWTARSDIHWMVPVAAGVPFGCGLLCVFVSGTVYLVETYGTTYSASAMAASGIMRYSFGMAFPLFVTQMYQRLTIPWASSLLGFVAIALLPIPFVICKCGPALRARSIFVGRSMS